MHFLIKKINILQSLLDFSCSLALLLSTATIADLYKIHNTGILGWIECYIWNNELLSFGLFLSSTWNVVVLTLERFVSPESSIDYVLHYLLHLIYIYIRCGQDHYDF